MTDDYERYVRTNICKDFDDDQKSRIVKTCKRIKEMGISDAALDNSINAACEGVKRAVAGGCSTVSALVWREALLIEKKHRNEKRG